MPMFFFSPSSLILAPIFDEQGMWPLNVFAGCTTVHMDVAAQRRRGTRLVLAVGRGAVGGVTTPKRTVVIASVEGPTGHFWFLI